MDASERVRTGVEENVVVLEELDENGDVVERILENVVGDPDPDSSVVVPTPTKGMEFNSGIEFVAYMHRYGHSVGFGVRIYGSEKDPDEGKEGEDVDVDSKLVQWFNLENKYQNSWKIRTVCRKQGKLKSRSKDPNRSTRTCKTGCLYVVNACRTPRKGTIWRITEVKGVHNHPLNPLLSRHLPWYRRISLDDGMIAIQLHKGGVRMCSMFDIFVNKYKSYAGVPFTKEDLHNFIYFMDRKPLKDSDFGGMEVHFKKMREISLDFFYEYDVDQSYTLKSVFWADSRCRKAFKEFGDVVSFDTTFLSNRYKMPFAPFIGVNHHGNTMLFGCALIGKEDTTSFEWLFKVSKRCMGKAPDCILTDQDKAIGNVVASVFPESSHRWCIWHVKKNFRKHHGMLPNYKEIAKKLKGILHDSLSVEEFETGWHKWVSYYDFGSSTWVKDMYAVRSKWVPIYFKNTFWAGMSSTQRSEGMNHYLKTIVNINTSLTQFVKKYAKAVCQRIEEEGKNEMIGADLSSRETTTHLFEPIFQKLYTREKFLDVHDELVQMNHNIATVKHVENDRFVVYDVLVKTFRVGWTRRQDFNVSMDRDTLEVKCDCRNFEFKGIMCAHMLRVFWMEETAEIPEKYVLRRWCKNVPREYLSDSYPAAALLGQEQIEAKRYAEIHTVAREICVQVMNSEELHKEILETLTALNTRIRERMDNPVGITSYEVGGLGRVYRSIARGMEGGNLDKERVVDDDRDACSVKDPIDKRGRGRQPTKRKLSFLDKKGKGKGDHADTNLPESTPTKDIERNMFPGQWGTSYAPKPGTSNIPRHGFKVSGSSGNIPVYGYTGNGNWK